MVDLGRNWPKQAKDIHSQKRPESLTPWNLQSKLLFSTRPCCAARRAATLNLTMSLSVNPRDEVRVAHSIDIPGSRQLCAAPVV